MKKVCIAIIFMCVQFGVASGQNTDRREVVVNTLESFQQAILENDTTKAKNLLSDSARILEGGRIETRKEYLSHHFYTDGKFLGVMDREMENRTVSVSGNTAWVSTKSRMWGTYNGRELDLSSLELAVLKKIDGNWKITALHWSSGERNE